MKYPEELFYSKSHEWVKLEGDCAWIGITDFAQDALGDLVYVNHPEVGDEVMAGETFADVESVKGVSDIYSPVTGTVAEINEALLDAPETINQSPYEAWLIKVEGVTDKEELLSAAAYQEMVETEEK